MVVPSPWFGKWMPRGFGLSAGPFVVNDRFRDEATMPKLSLIESEAARLLGRMPEAKRRALQQALVDACEAHWLEIRGPEPGGSLAHALWSLTPPLADLLADMHAEGAVPLQGRKAAQDFALLALAEIERGNAEGVRLAHAPMMLFQSPTAGMRYAERVAAALRGEGGAPQVLAARPALWKALAGIAAHTGRCDLGMMMRVIGLLADGQAADAGLEQLRSKLGESGVRFLGMDDAHIRFEVHGREHRPVSAKQLGDLLGEIRQARLF